MTDGMKKVGEVATQVKNYSTEKLLQLLGGLFMEQKEDGKWIASLGRTSFWIVFVHVMYFFHANQPIAAEEMNVFYALLGYQGVKIGKNMVTEGATAWKSGS